MLSIMHKKKMYFVFFTCPRCCKRPKLSKRSGQAEAPWSAKIKAEIPHIFRKQKKEKKKEKKKKSYVCAYVYLKMIVVLE